MDETIDNNAGEATVNPATPPPNPLHPMIQHYQNRTQAIKTQFDKLKESQSRLSTVRGLMDSLVSMGDSIEESDVVKAAGKMVSAGLAPMAVAGLLADAPSNGEALQAWIKNQDNTLRQREIANNAMLGMSRQALGVEAMRTLIAHSAVPTLFGGGNDTQQPPSTPAQPADLGPLALPTGV